MRIPEAVFAIERAVAARGTDGRSTEVEQIDCDLADASTVVATVYFANDDEPLDLLVELETPATETTFDRRALARGLETRLARCILLNAR